MNTNITDAAIRLTPQQGSRSESASVRAVTAEPAASPQAQTVQQTSFRPAEAAVESEPQRPEQLEQSVDALNKVVQSIERDLQFRVDDHSGRTVVTVVDTKTDEVIRQIPAEHVLAFAESVDNLRGILFSVEV